MRNRRNRNWMTTCFVVVVVLVGATGCEPAVAPYAGTDQYPLQHHWGPAIVIEAGAANSCVTRGSDVPGRQHYCRVVDGVSGYGVNEHITCRVEGGTILSRPPQRLPLDDRV